MRRKIGVTTLVVFSLILTLLTVYALIPLQSSVGAVKLPPPLTVLPPLSIPKFTNELTGPPPVYTAGATGYEVFMKEFDQQILPLMTFPGGAGPENRLTKVWGYGGETAGGYVESSPGPSFDVTTGTGIQVKYINMINNRNNIQFAVDPTLHWANPLNGPMPQPPDPILGFNAFPPGYDYAQTVVPLVPHLHGGEVAPTADGGPDAWWTSGGIQGPGFNSSTAAPMSAPLPTAGTDNWAVFDYPNTNPASTLWYHDHALGVTRLNVMSGLAGFYIVRDTSATSAALAGITGKYDMPLVFQDRNFDPNGQLLFPSLGVQPAVHPYWIPEFFGEVIMVNGKAWPNMNVDDEVYRFRLLDGSNARFYTISFVVTKCLAQPGLVGTNVPFTIIASDGGYLANPVQRGLFNTIDPLAQFTFAPGERVEVLIDFSLYPDGTEILVKNTANENFPFGLPVNPLTAGMVMQFTVKPDPLTTGPTMPTLPTPLNPTLATGTTPTFPTLTSATATGTTHTGVGYYRMLTLVEALDPVTKVPLELLLDGQKWGALVSEGAQVGSTEEWIIYNPTADSHPIHLHLVQFQLISRQTFNAKAYYDDWLKANGGVLPLTTKTLNAMAWPNRYKVGPAVGPLPEEQGWKDTIMVHPGQITKIRVRYAPIGAAETPGTNQYPFDPTVKHGPGIPGKYDTGLPYGYVWHCHIIDHEDNEMMRPLQLVKGTLPADAPFGTYATPPTGLVGKQKMPPFA